MAKKRIQDRPRYASGRAKPLPKAVAEAQRMATVLQHRQKHFMRYLAAPGEAATDRRYGSVIGKLSLQNIISLTQYDTALEYERVRREFLNIKVEQRPTSPCQLAAMVFGTGRSTSPGMSTRIAVSKSEYHEGMMERLKEFETIPARYDALINLLDHVTVYDDEMEMNAPNVTNLRSALNVLAKYFQYVRD